VKSEVNRDLLIDLARLARKYPTEDWASLIAWLQDESRRTQLITLLQELSSVSKRLLAKAPHRKRLLPIPHLLEEMKSQDLAKAELLSDFWRKLRNRELLTSASSLRTFAEAAGLKGTNWSKREQAINRLIRELAELPLKEIQTALERTSAVPRERGGEYERWVALILDRNR